MTKSKRTTTNPNDLQAALQRAIANSGKTHYQIAKESTVNTGIIDRFCRGERDIVLATASKLAKTLGLRLVHLEE